MGSLLLSHPHTIILYTLAILIIFTRNLPYFSLLLFADSWGRHVLRMRRCWERTFKWVTRSGSMERRSCHIRYTLPWRSIYLFLEHIRSFLLHFLFFFIEEFCRASLKPSLLLLSLCDPYIPVCYSHFLDLLSVIVFLFFSLDSLSLSLSLLISCVFLIFLIHLVTFIFQITTKYSVFSLSSSSLHLSHFSLYYAFLNMGPATLFNCVFLSPESRMENKIGIISILIT